jgi:PAS domain S-box-containing protein
LDTQNSKVNSLDNLVHLPRFANYLLKEKLNEFLQKQIEYGIELNVPLLKFFLSLPNEQRFEIGKQTTTGFLNFLAANKASEQINNSIQQWKENQLPVINRNEIVAEDITLINYMRKKAMLHFITGYTTDVYEMLELIKEIDLFIIQSITAATTQYMSLFKQRIEEDSHFIHKVAETIPGAVYVFDVENYKGIYANNKLADVIGYPQDELNKLGESAISKLIHPDDRENIRQQLVAIRSSSNDEPNIFKYRILKKDGSYKWLSNYESVFKRKKDGGVSQTIGITLDIDKEQRAVEELHNSERKLLEAQDIAQLGNYYWDIEDKTSFGSAKTYELLESGPNDFNKFIERVHPDDREKISLSTKKAFATGYFDCEYRIQGKNGIKFIWARGMVDYKDGKAAGITGTVMDVTDHKQLIQRLEKADKRHKQAEALTHIGTYSWNFIKDEIEWSDEMYSIYEAGKEEVINFQYILDAVHPDDKKILDDLIKERIGSPGSYDFYYRIISKTGQVKILHSRGEVELNEQGTPEKIVGTDQDVTEKQTLIRRLRKSESLYKQAEEIAAMGNWSWDVKANKLEWTDQLYRIYGLEPQSEEITIERFLSFVHPDDREYVEKGVAELNIDTSLDYTFRIVTENGVQKWLRSIAQVLRDEKGDVHHIIGIEQDVTEKQKLIGKLEESQRLYKQAQELARMGNFTWKIQTGEVFWSDEVYKIYERPYGETVKFDDAFNPIIDEHKTQVKAAIGETMSTKKGQSVSYAIRKKDGGLKYVNLHTDVSLTHAGEVACIVGTAQDVTEQREAVETIKEQEYFIQQIADASPTILYLFDVSLQSMLYINREAFFVLGYSPDEIVDTGDAITATLYHPDDVQLLPARMQSKTSFHQVDSMIQYECRLKHKEGDYRWFLVREIVFKTDEQGSITQIIGAALDITRRKEMEKTILQNTHQLEQSNASLEEFAYVASHDLKEPLRKISTFGDRLIASHIDKLDADGKIYLRKIVEASRRMQNMISDLLSISMISGNRAFELTNLQKILDDTIQTLEFKIEQQKAIIEYDVLPEANVIPSQFRQLFQNLIANSLKFVKEDVQPVIIIKCATTTGEELSSYQLAKASSYFKISFTDNGIGFEKEYSQKIFSIFQRLHGRSEYEGSGIGLAICKKIIEHHGGVIFADAKLNEGATFTIIFPV